MTGRRKYLPLGPLFLVAVLLLNGCSLIGVGIGSQLDPDEELRENHQSAHLQEIKIGDEIGVQLWSGAESRGIFRGLGQPMKDELHSMLKNAERAEGALEPQCGDDITLVMADDRSIPARYIGCDFRGVYYQRSSDGVTMYVINPLLDHLRLQDGTLIHSSYLTKAVSTGDLPAIGVIHLESEGREHRIPLEDVQFVTTMHSSRTWRVVGFFVGLAVDAYLIYAMIDKNSSSQPSQPKNTGGGSSSSGGAGAGGACGCPFVYGWDGEEYRVEGECYSGAVFEAAQRRDWMRLEHTRPDDGTLRLRVYDLLEEVDYIDHLAVLRVQHEAVTEVIPTEDGRLLECRLTEPRSALDDEGRDVLPLVSGGTDRWWLSHPAGRLCKEKTRGQDVAPVRPGLTVTFPKPADADSVTLVARLQNTDRGAELQYGFFQLFGSTLPAQYDRWNRDAEARTALRQVMLREGMLRVSVWSGSEWYTAGYFWEVGLAAFRSVALPLDVSGITGDELKLRFDAPAGVWMVGEIGIDPAAPRPLIPERIPVATARRHDGSDCTEVLHAEDGNHLVLDTGEWADVQFDIPKTTVTADRGISWILESSGYYRMKLDTTAPVQAEILQRIFTEPGFFAEFAALKWRERVSTAMMNVRR